MSKHEAELRRRSYEQKVRRYALHLALLVRRRGDVLTLRERYDFNGQAKRKLGEYRSFRAVERAIERYGDKVLREP
jgi:hypothetical protein